MGGQSAAQAARPKAAPGGAPLQFLARHLELMPSGPERNSQERLLRLREQEKRIAAELRSARRMQRHAGDIPADVSAAARAVHLRAGPSTTLALAFLEHHRPGARARAATLQEGLRAIWHASTPAERASAAVEPGAPALGNAWRRAGKWMQEAGLHTWVHDLNVAKGIAPVASLTLAEARRRQVASPHRSLVRSLGPKGSQQWLRRWRARWQVRLARLLPGDRLPPAESLRKASAPSLPPGIFRSGSRAERLASR